MECAYVVMSEEIFDKYPEIAVEGMLQLKRQRLENQDQGSDPDGN